MKIQQDDKEFLLCFFAGQAMQGLLANPSYTSMLENNPSFDENQVKLAVALNCIGYAQNLLEEVSKHGKQ